MRQEWSPLNDVTASYCAIHCGDPSLKVAGEAHSCPQEMSDFLVLATTVMCHYTSRRRLANRSDLEGCGRDWAVNLGCQVHLAGDRYVHNKDLEQRQLHSHVRHELLENCYGHSFCVGRRVVALETQSSYSRLLRHPIDEKLLSGTSHDRKVQVRVLLWAHQNRRALLQAASNIWAADPSPHDQRPRVPGAKRVARQNSRMLGSAASHCSTPDMAHAHLGPTLDRAPGSIEGGIGRSGSPRGHWLEYHVGRWSHRRPSAGHQG